MASRKQCRGVLWGEMLAGVIRVVHEDDQGRKMYNYHCQRCRSIIVSPNSRRKMCTLPREDETA